MLTRPSPLRPLLLASRLSLPSEPQAFESILRIRKPIFSLTHHAHLCPYCPRTFCYTAQVPRTSYHVHHSCFTTLLITPTHHVSVCAHPHHSPAVLNLLSSLLSRSSRSPLTLFISPVNHLLSSLPRLCQSFTPRLLSLVSSISAHISSIGTLSLCSQSVVITSVSLLPICSSSLLTHLVFSFCPHTPFPLVSLFAPLTRQSSVVITSVPHHTNTSCWHSNTQRPPT